MTKQTVRETVWEDLEESGVARFPFPPHGRIPNFAGADDAASRLAEQPEWDAASVIKANPDAPQRPVRRRALAAGKTVYMAVPRLRDPECFIRLHDVDPDRGSTIDGADELGDRVGPEAAEPIQLIVAGSVAVSTTGARIGKGEGYSDLEYGVLRELDLVDEGTPVATTVHDRQVIDRRIETDPHDVPLDLICTPSRVIRTETPLERPAGIAWDRLDAERRSEIPVLQRLAPEGP